LDTAAAESKRGKKERRESDKDGYKNRKKRVKSLEYKSGPNTAVSNIPSVFIKCEHAPSTHEKQIIKTKHERTDLGIVFRWDSQWKFIRHISHYVQLELCHIAMK